jgi:hypothetical protein
VLLVTPLTILLLLEGVLVHMTAPVAVVLVGI